MKLLHPTLTHALDRRERRALKWTGLVLLVFAIFPHLVSQPVVRLMLHEDAVVETISAWLWLVPALAALAYLRPPRMLLISYAIAFCVLAVREFGIPPSIGGGKQFVTAAFYLGDTPLPLRLLAGCVLISALLALLYSAWGSLRNLHQPDELAPADLRMLVLAAAVLAFSQLFEVSQGWAEPLGDVALPFIRSMWSVEEGLEAWVPILFSAALLPPRWHSRQG